MAYRTLRLVMGDQLNAAHSWWQSPQEDVLYVMMELRQETDYVKHHIQKVVGFFLAMRAFAECRKAEGHHVDYWPIDDARQRGSLVDHLDDLIEKHEIERFEYLLPDEYRLDEQLRGYGERLAIRRKAVQVKAYDTEHFLTTRTTVEELFRGKKTYLMERFYREMRKKYKVLMEEDGKTPLTGKWNYDASNRKKLPKKITLPPPKHFYRDVSDLVETIEEMEIQTIGNIVPSRFDWPVTRAEQLELLDHFVRLRLAHFGTYQDAMTERDYLLFHSRLSFGMNVKLIHPLEVVEAVIAYWEQHPSTVDIAQVEGFVRQIIGWREYMRGIYWAKMPEYRSLNVLEHTAPLPDYFWTGETQMQCVGHAVRQSLDRAYAHHIQRLMVTGNFALLLGVHPDELDAWYLGIYMDAIEWVEITNTRGMSQFADGGIVGTKPYVSSANYMHKMGDYCSNCQYDRKVKYGHKACPFNSLYWDFYARHDSKLRNNPRIGMMYRLWDKMDATEKEKILAQAAHYKANASQL